MIPALLVMAGQQAVLTPPTGLTASATVLKVWTFSWTNAVPTARTAIYVQANKVVRLIDSADPGVGTLEVGELMPGDEYFLLRHYKGTRYSVFTSPQPLV